MRTTRREPLLGTAGTLAATAFPAFERSPENDAAAQALIDRTAELLLRTYPESATSLGLDTGTRAGLRRQLQDRSLKGQARMAAALKATLGDIGKLDMAALS